MRCNPEVSRVADEGVESEAGRRVEAPDTPVAHPASDSDLRSEPIAVVPTGCPWFDSHMQGGQSGGEVYGLAFPSGHGKTTLGIQLAVNAARQFRIDEQATGVLRHAHFFNYEEPIHPVLHRAQSCAAEISKTRLNYEITDWEETMSRRGALLPYEIDMYRAKGYTSFDDLDGELERAEAAKELIDRNMHLWDMSRPAVTARGAGGAAELGAILHDERRQGRILGLVVVDRAAAALRHCAGRDLGVYPQYSREFRRLVADSARLVARPFRVPVWLLLNYAGAREGQPGEIKRLGDLEEARSLAPHLDYCFLCSRLHPDTRIGVMHVAKAVRGGTAGNLALIRMVGDFARFEPAGAGFELVVEDGRLRPTRGVTPNRPQPAAHRQHRWYPRIN
jgi:RecA/RadA recombinase